MANKYLAREDAPFSAEMWSKIDNIVVDAAKSQMSARKLLDIEGPFGIELKSVPLNDQIINDGDVKLLSGGVLPVPLIETEFSLSARDLSVFEETGFALDTEAVVKAAMAVAAMENELIFEGNKQVGISGLLNTAGTQSIKLNNWQEIGTAANDIIGAINTLDKAGFHGPYTLALSNDLYNMLFRLYPQGYQIELQHIISVVGSSVIKAPGIKNGGVLLASGKQFASIVMGQDLITGFIGPEGPDYRFKISESLVPWIRVPSAACVLKA